MSQVRMSHTTTGVHDICNWELVCWRSLGNFLVKMQPWLVNAKSKVVGSPGQARIQYQLEYMCQAGPVYNICWQVQESG